MNHETLPAPVLEQVPLTDLWDMAKTHARLAGRDTLTELQKFLDLALPPKPRPLTPAQWVLAQIPHNLADGRYKLIQVRSKMYLQATDDWEKPKAADRWVMFRLKADKLVLLQGEGFSEEISTQTIMIGGSP